MRWRPEPVCGPLPPTPRRSSNPGTLDKARLKSGDSPPKKPKADKALAADQPSDAPKPKKAPPKAREEASPEEKAAAKGLGAMTRSAISPSSGPPLWTSEEWLGHDINPHLKVLRGSNASRVASPMKIKSDSITDKTRKPIRPSQGA